MSLNLDLLGQDGRWVLIGLMGGRQAEMDLGKVLGKRIRIIGSTLRNRSVEFQGQDHEIPRGQGLAAKFAEGKLNVNLERRFAAQNAEAALPPWKATR